MKQIEIKKTMYKSTSGINFDSIEECLRDSVEHEFDLIGLDVSYLETKDYRKVGIDDIVSTCERVVKLKKDADKVAAKAEKALETAKEKAASNGE